MNGCKGWGLSYNRRSCVPDEWQVGLEVSPSAVSIAVCRTTVNNSIFCTGHSNFHIHITLSQSTGLDDDHEDAHAFSDDSKEDNDLGHHEDDEYEEVSDNANEDTDLGDDEEDELEEVDSVGQKED